MRKRRLVWIGLLGLAVLIAGWVLLALLSSNPLNAEHCARIYDGMSEREVEAMLGGPAHESEPILEVDPDTGEPRPSKMVIRRWFGGGGSIVLITDEAGTVSAAAYYPSPSFWDRVRRWLGF